MERYLSIAAIIIATAAAAYSHHMSQKTRRLSDAIAARVDAFGSQNSDWSSKALEAMQKRTADNVLKSPELAALKQRIEKTTAEGTVVGEGSESIGTHVRRCIEPSGAAECRDSKIFCKRGTKALRAVTPSLSRPDQLLNRYICRIRGKP